MVPAVTMSGVSQVLQSYPEDCRGGRIEPLDSGGGLSGALFWRLTTPRGTLCLRRWPAALAESGHLAWIHCAVRGAARQCKVPLPLPIDATGGDSFVQSGGNLWELTPWLEGAPLSTSPDDWPRVPAAMQALAELHLALAANAVREGAANEAQVGPAAGVHKRLAALRGMDFSHLVSEAGRFPPGDPLAALVHRLLETLIRRWPTLSTSIAAELQGAMRLAVPLQPCLRDVWRPHVLFRGGEVSGIIDFGALGIDTVATDVARLLGSLVGEAPEAGRVPAGWPMGLAAYMATRPLSRNERRLVATYDRSGVLIGAANWLRWLAVERRSFPPAADVAQRVCRLADRLGRLEATAVEHPAVL